MPDGGHSVTSAPDCTRRCPLCRSTTTRDFCSLQGRDYLECETCALVWLVPSQRQSRSAELAEYQLHNNDPSDARYRQHLARLTKPLLARLPKRAQCGLDFGSGPGPTIAPMLGEQGFNMTNYDPFFAPDTSALARTYDFITCTETVEHFHNPGNDFALLARLIKPGGLIGIMTSLRLSEIDFANWHYITQPSHVSFYAPDTIKWIAAYHGWRAEIIGPDITIFLA